MPVQKEFSNSQIDWKHVVGLLLNFFIWPGTGTWLLGKSRLGQLQMLAYLVSSILILSGGFGITGTFLTLLGIVGLCALISSWAWSAYTVVKEIHSLYYK